jgi:hypothetical protein
VKEKQGEKTKPDMNYLFFKICALSKQPLDVSQIVCCKLGKLFNKESIIKHLISKNMGDYFYIKSLNDVIPVNFTLNLSNNEDKSKFVCPITKNEFFGYSKVYLYKKCGHVISEEAIKQLNDDKICLVCDKEHNDSDKIKLNPTPSEEKLLRKKYNIIKKKRKLEDEKSKENKKLKTEKIEINKTEKHVISIPKKDEKLKNEKDEKIIDKNEELDLSVPKNATEKIYKSIFSKDKNHDVKENNFCNTPGMRSLMDL